MRKKILLRISSKVLLLTLTVTYLAASPTLALGSSQNPQSGSTGLEGTVQAPPPTEAATIAVPSNGQVFTSTPITVSGLCKSGLLVKIFSNNVFVGSVVCTSGSFSLKIDLFSGRNDLIARVYDALDQAGPDSNTVSVIFNDAQFAQFATRVTLSSNYARLGVNPGSVLSWPIILSGGKGPYALSVDWGDGGSPELKSISAPGVINLTHIYSQAGVFNIVIKVTDADGTSAYLQVVGVATGKIIGGMSTSPSQNSPTKVLWQPLLVTIPLCLIAFWLGQKHELYSIRRSLEANREEQRSRVA